MGSNPSVTNLNELIIFYRIYGTSLWFRVDGSVDRTRSPQGDDPADSKLYDFTITFKDPKDNNGNPLMMTNGDEIAVVETLECLAILDDIKCGSIVKTVQVLKGWSRTRWISEFTVTVETRDWSTHPFSMGLLNFPNQYIIQDLVDVLNVIFGFDLYGNPNTRNDLGGVLANGTVIPKYDLLSPTTNVQIIDTKEGSMNTLTEYTNAIGFLWRPVIWVEPDATNGIHVIEQVQIWQNI